MVQCWEPSHGCYRTIATAAQHLPALTDTRSQLQKTTLASMIYDIGPMIEEYVVYDGFWHFGPRWEQPRVGDKEIFGFPWPSPRAA